jgi:cytochrome P450
MLTIMMGVPCCPRHRIPTLLWLSTPRHHPCSHPRSTFSTTQLSDEASTTMLYLYIAVLITAFLTYRLFTKTIRNRRFKAFADSHGCAPVADVTPPTYCAKYARLIRFAKDFQDPDREDMLDDAIAEPFQLFGVNTTYEKLFEGQQMYFTLEPANIQALLATQFQDFGTGHERYQQFKPVLGKSIFSSDGAFWEHSRALFRPQFSRENINDLEATDKASMALIKAIEPIGISGWTNVVELQPLFFNFTLDTASEFLFGESIDSQEAALRGDEDKAGHQAKKFSEDFKIVTDVTLTRVRLQSLYWLGDGLRFRKAVRNTKHFVEHWIRLALDPERLSRAENGKKNDNLLNRLATQTKDRQELRDQTLAILFAGRDTTASLLGWCFTRLALHQDYFAKLRSIVVKEFPVGQPVNFAKLKGCRELQHFISEVLRLHPTVPLNYRVAKRDTTIPVGGGPDGRSPVAIRQGEFVYYSVYLMQRRKDRKLSANPTYVSVLIAPQSGAKTPSPSTRIVSSRGSRHGNSYP